MLPQFLETLSAAQQDVSNSLLLRVALQACDEPKLDKADERRRRDQFNGMCETLGDPKGRLAEIALADLIETWWQGERELETQVSASGHCLTGEHLLYRVLIMFSRNHSLIPFSKSSKSWFGQGDETADGSYFEGLNAKLFSRFAEMLQKHIRDDEDDLAREFSEYLTRVQDTNIDRSLYSAKYRLFNKDKDVLKGFIVGGVAGVVTSMMFGPIIGGWIGQMAGFSGAAATSFGLALLGGGSLVSGGFGMIGGTIVLGVAFATVNGGLKGARAGEIEALEMTQAMRNLPILLATGRQLHELGLEELPKAIERLVYERYASVRERCERVRVEYPDGDHLAAKSLEITMTLYEAAWTMAKGYDWRSGYDLLKKVL